MDENDRRQRAEKAHSQSPEAFEVYARDLKARPEVSFDRAWMLLDDESFQPSINPLA